MGCGGGWLDAAFRYFEQTGVVSESCFPYHSGSDGQTGQCINQCQNGESFRKYKCQAGSIVHPVGVDQIYSELYTNGPLEASFAVYDDFFSYAGGVYHQTSSNLAGYHAIKVLGWGVENGENYFLCANSWGEGWGDHGFFKIRHNEVGINDDMWGCLPDLSSVGLKNIY